MGIHHCKLRLAGLGQLPAPVGKAVLLGQGNHAHKHRRAGIVQDQDPAGLLILLDHVVNGLDQGRYIKGVDIAQRFFKRHDQLIFNALLQSKAVAVMGIEGGAVELRQCADLLHRDPVDRLLLQQLQKGLLEHHLRIAFSGIQLLHTEPS